MSHIGVDGFPRPQKEDEKISMDIKALLGTPAGKEVLRISALLHWMR